MKREEEIEKMAKVIDEMYRGKTFVVCTPERTAEILVKAGFGDVKDRYEIGQKIEIDSLGGWVPGIVVGSIITKDGRATWASFTEEPTSIRPLPERRKKTDRELAREVYSREGTLAFQHNIIEQLAIGRTIQQIAKDYSIDMETES